MKNAIATMVSKSTYHILAGVIFMVLAVGGYVLAAGFFEQRAETWTLATAEALDRGLETDTRHLLATARNLDSNRVFDRHIRSRDIAQLLSAAIAERDRRGLDGLLIADRDGVVLTRSKAVQRRGDFIYHTTVWGRALAEGREVASVERGSAHPLDVLGAVPMERDGEPFGSIVAAYIVDDAYAAQVKQAYLPAGAEVAFYQEGKGVIGHSFADPQHGRTLSFYFSEGTDFFRSTSTVKRVTFEDDEYFVRHAFVRGMEDPVAHALVFVPAASELQAAATGTAAMVGFFGLLLVLWPYLPGRRFLKVVVAGVLVAGAGGIGYTLHHSSLDTRTIHLTQPSYAIYNSTMELDPPVAAFNRQFESRVGIRLFSGGEAINAVEVHLAFDPDRVRVTDIDFSRSFCNENLIIERHIDNEAGEVAIVCGLPNPGFSERAGIVADLALQPLTTGNFTLTFAEGTQVLANDGLGTQVLRYATDGSYVVVDEVDPQDGMSSSFLVFSPTHTNPERWYNARDVEFTWTRQSEGAYRYSLTDDATSSSLLENGTQTTEESALVRAPGDGIYYFHLGRTGEMVRHKVKVDTEPPASPRIRTSIDQPRVGELVRFEFESSDRLSGLQNNFYIKLNDGIFLPVGDTFATAFFRPGEHQVTVRAFDQANNYSESTMVLQVRSGLAATVLNTLHKL